MVDRQLNSKLNSLELNQMFVDVEKTFSQNAVNASLFFKFASTPIIDESDLLERAEVMDLLMSLVTSETYIMSIIANAISDRIEEFEMANRDSVKVSPTDMLKELIEIKNLKQSDLSQIATQSVISEILNGKRQITLNQAKGFADFFKLPVDTFIQC